MNPAILLLLRKMLPYIAAGAAVVALLVFVDHRGYRRGVASQQPAIAALNATIADVRLKTQQAKADDAIYAASVERAQAVITEEKSNAIEASLAAARADASAYAARLRAASSADKGGKRISDLPRSAVASGPTIDPADMADVDAKACAENTVKAQDWLDWYTAQTKVAR